VLPRASNKLCKPTPADVQLRRRGSHGKGYGKVLHVPDLASPDARTVAKVKLVFGGDLTNRRSDRDLGVQKRRQRFRRSRVTERGQESGEQAGDRGESAVLPAIPL